MIPYGQIRRKPRPITLDPGRRETRPSLGRWLSSAQHRAPMPAVTEPRPAPYAPRHRGDGPAR